jgi:hypothetical protein
LILVLVKIFSLVIWIYYRKIWARNKIYP